MHAEKRKPACSLLAVVCNTITAFLGMFVLLTTPPMFAQTTTGQRLVYAENGRTISNGVTVHFKEPVFDLAEGKYTAKVSDFKRGFDALERYFSELELQHGEIIFYKLVPSFKWGDVWRKNVVTKQPVKIFDLSQLYSIEFQQAIPIDDIVADLEKMETVQYAHEPVQVVALNQPNDPCYNDVTGCFTYAAHSDQWNLKKVDAEKAWGLTTGDPNIVVGVVDPESFRPSHPDLAANFILSANTDTVGTPGLHGTQVSGVIAAVTDNNTGIASLGWNIRMKPFAFSDGDVPGDIVAKLDSARKDDDVRIINCSFVTRGSDGCSKKYPDITKAISNAISQGKIVVAGIGNIPFGGTCQFPYTPYPAAYDSVLGVAATTFSDGHPSNYNYGVEFTDISAPGYEIVTTTNGGYWQVNGTSFAAPHVSALVGLMLSVNKDLDCSQIENILESTAVNVGSASFFGAGRINAYEAVLEAAKKSFDADATGNNSGRAIVRDNSGDYHFVFGSGGNIYYRRSLGGGTVWQAAATLSTGSGNQYPSITADGGNLYVTWRQNTGGSQDVYFHKSTDGGNTWNDGDRQLLAASVGSSDPLPVIASPSGNNVVVAYRKGGSIESKHSSNNGGAWSTKTISGSAHNAPSLAPGRTPWTAASTVIAYATGDVPNASDIKVQYYYNGWTSEQNLSSGLPGNFSQHARPSIACSGDFSQNKTHVAWDAYNSFRSAHVILHKVLSTWNNPSAYYELYYQEQNRPSITGLAGATAAMLFQRNSGSLIRAEYNGSYWTTFFEGSGKYPSLSVGNSQAKYVYTSGSSAPYDVVLSTTVLSKSSPEPVVYNRAASLVDEKQGAWSNLVVEGFAIKREDGSSTAVAFTPAPPDTAGLTAAQAWDALSSVAFTLPADAESLVVKYSFMSDKALSLKQGAAVEMQFTASTIGANAKVSNFPKLALSSNRKVTLANRRLSVAAKAFTPGETMAFKTRLRNQRRGGLSVSLGHIYDFSGTSGQKIVAKSRAGASGEASSARLAGARNYPNPFNPETTIT